MFAGMDLTNFFYCFTIFYYACLFKYAVFFVPLHSEMSVCVACAHVGVPSVSKLYCEILTNL